MRTTATWIALGLMSLAVAACQPKPAADAPAPAAPAVAAAPIALAPPAALPAVTELPPETVLAVTQALAAAQAFDARSAEDTAAATKAERRIRELAGQATEAAGRSASASGNERLKLAQRVAAARTEAEAAHAELAPRLAAFRATAQVQTDALAAAQLPCAGDPAFAASELCVKLLAEQAAVSQTVAALTARFAAAEAAYQKDRPRLEEASAIMALGSR